jgi:hypothetical protein
MPADADRFIIHRLRSKPVEYTITLRHFVSGGEWMLGVLVNDIENSQRAKEAIASDLRYAAAMLDDTDDITDIIEQLKRGDVAGAIGALTAMKELSPP